MGDGALRQQRHGQQAVLQAGVLPAGQLRLDEPLVGEVGALALDGVADGPGQQAGVDVLLDEEVLGALGHRRDAHVRVVEPGQHEHGDVGRHGQYLAQRLHAVGVGQRQVDEHALDVAVEALSGLGDAARPGDRGWLLHLLEQLLDQEGVARVILDQQQGRHLWQAVCCHVHL
ncbi:hypothetical protein GCM10020219_045320 [Nonomuraea dietziae]